MHGSTPYPYLNGNAVNPEMSVRKLVAFRRTKFAEIDKFRSDLGLRSEGEAIRRLIDVGLEFYRKPQPQPQPQQSAKQNHPT